MCRSDCQGRREWPCVIWGLRREVAENCALKDSGGGGSSSSSIISSSSSSNLILTFRGSLLVSSSGLRTALFWVITQRVVVSYRRFGTTCRSCPQGLELRSSGLLHRE